MNPKYEITETFKSDEKDRKSGFLNILVKIIRTSANRPQDTDRTTGKE